MDGDIYHTGHCGENHLLDPLQEFNLDLQHVLLGDYSFAASDEFCFSSDVERIQLKSGLFDEDEGFDVSTTRSTLQQNDTNRCSRDTGVDTVNPAAMINPAVSEIASFLQSGSRDQDQCLPDEHIDSCYGNSIWTNELPTQLISARDHMMSSPVKIHENNQQISREPSPTLQAMQSEDIYYNERLSSRNEPNNKLPNHEELVGMPFYKFKRLLDNPSLSTDDKAKVKAIRKKGKNKSAARHCRQRKMAMLEGLEQEVASLQQQRAALARQKAQLIAEAKHWESKCASLQ